MWWSPSPICARAADRARLDDFATALGARIDVVALATGTVTLPDGVLERGQALVAAHETPPLAGADAYDLTHVDLGWPAGLPDGARHGFLPEHRAVLEAALPELGRRLAAALPPGARRVLVLGNEELMYAPLRLAQALGDQAQGLEVRYSTTTARPSCRGRPRLRHPQPAGVPRHDEPTDGPGDRYAYNVAGAGFDAVVCVIDSSGETPELYGPGGLIAQLAAHTDDVLLAVVPAYRPQPRLRARLRSRLDAGTGSRQAPPSQPRPNGLSGPMSDTPEHCQNPARPRLSSYAAHEVGWLLKDLSEVELEAPTEEREEAVQSGGAHYAESLPVEYQPSAEYQDLFKAALDGSAERIARAVGAVTELVLTRARPGRRPGVAGPGRHAGRCADAPLGAARARPRTAALRRLDRPRPGIDRNALSWLAAHHDRRTRCSWTAGQARAPSPANCRRCQGLRRHRGSSTRTSRCSPTPAAACPPTAPATTS